MTFSVAQIKVVAELVGDALPARTREALEQLEAAGLGVVTTVMPVASPVTDGDALRVARQPSAGALRQRRYRARKAALAAGDHVSEVRDMVEPVRKSHELAAQVTAEASPWRNAERHQASPKASHVTPGDGGSDALGKKRSSPHTPFLRKTQKIPKRRIAKRHGGDGGTAQPVISTVFLEAHDARYREIEVIRQRRFPIHSGGWWFPADLVAAAEARIAEKVRPLRSSVVAIVAATGPPGRAVGSG